MLYHILKKQTEKFGDGSVVFEATRGVRIQHTERSDRVARELEARGVPARLRWVPEDYYDQELEYRRDCLEADSTDRLCKSIVMENTRANVDDCSNPLNSKYYICLVQYNARFHNEKLIKFIYELNKASIPKKYFNMRLAPEDVSEQMTGYVKGAVVPVATKERIPIIISSKIVDLPGGFFWLGGGEVLLKLGMHVQDFLAKYEPFIADVTY